MGLSAPKNVRKVLPNCCACKRNGEPVWGDPMFIYETLCDGFKHINSRRKETSK